MTVAAEVLAGSHAIGRLARDMETGDAAKPSYRGSVTDALRGNEADVKTAEPCRTHGIGDATFHDRKANSGGIAVPEAVRLRVPEGEGRRPRGPMAKSRGAADGARAWRLKAGVEYADTSSCSASSTTTGGTVWPSSSIPRRQVDVSCGRL